MTPDDDHPRDPWSLDEVKEILQFLRFQRVSQELLRDVAMSAYRNLLVRNKKNAELYMITVLHYIEVFSCMSEHLATIISIDFEK